MGNRIGEVLFLAVGDEHNPGTRLRALAYRPFLEARGYQVRVLFPRGANPNRVRRRRFSRMLELARDLVAAGRAGCVVVYRKTFPGLTARLLRMMAAKVVYEFDDAVYLPSPSEPQGAVHVKRYQRNFAATVAAADLVIAGNAHLARQAQHPVTEIVPTAVDLTVFDPPVGAIRRDGCVLGWIGTAGNLSQWERLVPVFRAVVEVEPSVRFKVVSDRPPPSCDLPLDFELWTLEREAACLEDVDVGLMPLDDTPWNRGKCSCKALQCMAMRLPVVVSPVGMNRTVVDHDVSGFFASSDDEWVESLLRLARDPELRARMGRSARSTVEEHYSLDRVGMRMTQLIESLIT
jgi:glycosyltransferase involved in cell wall biosynthesis